MKRCARYTTRGKGLRARERVTREARTGGRAASTAIRDNDSRTPRSSETRTGASSGGNSSSATMPRVPAAGDLQAPGTRSRQPFGTGTIERRARDFGTGRPRASVRMAIRCETARQRDRVRDRIGHEAAPAQDHVRATKDRGRTSRDRRRRRVRIGRTAAPPRSRLDAIATTGRGRTSRATSLDDARPAASVPPAIASRARASSIVATRVILDRHHRAPHRTVTSCVTKSRDAHSSPRKGMAGHARAQQARRNAASGKSTRLRNHLDPRARNASPVLTPNPAPSRHRIPANPRRRHRSRRNEAERRRIAITSSR